MDRFKVKSLLLVILFTTLLNASVIVDRSLAEVDFKASIAPIFQKHCVTCHNDNDLKGDFSMQSASEFFGGGDSGAHVERNDADSSSLIDYIEGDEPEMPKEADPLSKNQVQLIRQWIDEGAKWPESFRIENVSTADLNWWSLKGLSRPELPDLNTNSANPIDLFVANKHRDLGLKFSEQADKVTLIRRLYYDLTGLPPSLEQIDEFVNSNDPKAYEKMVEKLLASPHYGEKWARHWLDVVHFGETHGYDKDKLRNNAWPYRDYVVRSLNNDKTYSRFVREQLAGDVLWPSTTDGIVGTGFMSAGPWDFIGHAEVPETKIDGRVARNLDRDNMVTSTMNTFCSLTIQCARCHNHKLDPVTMKEYYSLQAVFASIDRADGEYDLDPEVAKARSEFKQKIENAVSRQNKIESQIAEKKTAKLTKLEKELAALRDAMNAGAFPKVDQPRDERYGYHSAVAASAETEKWVQVDLGREISIQKIILFGAQEWGWKDFGFPQRYRIEASNDESFRERKTIVDRTDRDVTRPGSQPTVVDGNKTKARFIRVTATKLWNRRNHGATLTNDWIFALGELAVISNNHIASITSVSAKDSIEAPRRWGKSYLQDHIFGDFDLETKLGKSTSPSNGYHSQFASVSTAQKWVQIELPKPTQIGQVTVYPAFPTDFAPTPGFGFPLRFKIEVANDADFKNPTIIADQTKTDFPNPKTKPYVVDLHSLQIKQAKDRYRFVRLTATKLWDRGEKTHALAIGEITVQSNGGHSVDTKNVVASDSIDAGRWHTRFLVDGHTSRLPIGAGVKTLLSFQPNTKTESQIKNLASQVEQLTRETVGPSLLEERKTIAGQISELKAAQGKLPSPEKVYVGKVHFGSGAFRGRGGLGPREIRVLHRGEVTMPREVVQPGTVGFIASTPKTFELAKDHHEGQRRMALANWIVEKQNPLTWRSIVNRIWHYHFVNGIVDTPNDFGRGGSKPTHPDLLDWLAVEFRDGGDYLQKQSIKSLHRLICNSQTYKQRSSGDEFSKADKSNRFLWRMNRRRLTAEEIHDSALLAAGKLNRKIGGKSYFDFVLLRPEHSPHYEYHLFDHYDEKSHRRALYRFIVRSQPQPFMDTLNCADPSFSVPKRTETLTALQALGMMNNPFMVTMSDLFSERLRKKSDSLSAQIRVGYRIVSGREVGEKELHSLTEYASKHGLKNTCRILLNLNAFVFVD